MEVVPALGINAGFGFPAPGDIVYGELLKAVTVGTFFLVDFP